MLRLVRLLAVLLVVLLPIAAAPTASRSSGPEGRGAPQGRLYRLDAAHSHVEFSIRYLRMMEVKGRFREWDAAVLSPEEPERGAIAVVFRTPSLDTGNETRDNHLKSPDFFDVEAHPTAVFRSSRVERKAGGLVAHGRLTLKGVSRPLSISFRQAYEPTTDGKGTRRVGFAGSVEIDRTDFGIVGGNRFNAGFDPLVSIIDEKARIDFGLHAMIARTSAGAVDSLVEAVGRSGVAAVVADWHKGAPAGEDEQAKKARQQTAAVFNAAGFRLIEMGKDADAVELMRVAVLAAPGSARALAGLAEAQLRAGGDAAARENIGRALALDPLEVRALVLDAWMAGR